MDAAVTMPGFSTVAVIGAGLMGHGIALVHALGGSEVRLCDRSPSALDQARALIDEAAATLVAGGARTQDEADAATRRISFVKDLEVALDGTEYIVEAIDESVEAKSSLFGLIDALAGPDAVLASNTSYLDIFPILPDGLKARTLIVHWYTPPYIIDLVDVIPAPNVPEALADKVVSFLEGQGKSAVRLKKFIPGYLANRIQMAIESEIFHLLDDDVADPAEIDRAIMDGLALRLSLFGQFKKIDYTGLRIVRDSHNLGTYVPPVQPTASTKLDLLLEKGREGVSSGGGFYDYGGKEPAELYRERDLALLALKAATNARRREV